MIGYGNSQPVAAGAMQLIGALLEQRTGQQIAANRTWRIETALKPVVRECGLASLDELAAKLIGARTGELADKVVDALLNQETSFFRDVAVLDMVVEAARAMHAELGGRRLRIWCAGCSTGQEPLSLAMLFSEQLEAFGGQMPEIVASDVSQTALAKARAGHYSQFEIQRGLPVRRMVTWFDTVGGDWVAKPELTRKVQFRQHNLTTDVPPPGRFDIILCRNVLLYFSLAMRRHVFDRLATATRPGTLLVLGAGETVIGLTEHFTPCEAHRGCYRAVEGAAPVISAFG